jgi:mannose-6-phosphate isomerase-like protein (cupin superfamily)
MSHHFDYSIDLEVKFKSLEIIDVSTLIANCSKKWQNLTLCKVNDSVIRLAIIEGEFHWHKHDKDDEFFYVIEGSLLIDLEEKTLKLKPNQGIMVPMGVLHRTRAPSRTTILIMEKISTNPTGD